MDKMECEVDDEVVIENPEPKAKMRRILISEEARKRTKTLFEKAMIREKNKKLLKGHEILDCHIVEMNDSNDFSHQSKPLRTERMNRKPKTHTLPIPSTSSISDDEAHNFGPSTSMRFKDSIVSNAQGKEGPSSAQSEKDNSQGGKKCRFCQKEFAESALKDHVISCMKQTYERDVNSIQKENVENKPCCLEEVTKCHICGKDMSYLNSAKRASHINTCLDQKEDEKKQREEHEKQLQQAQSVILPCPVCQKKFRSTSSRTKHLKKCALSNNMSVEEIKNLAKQQQEEHKKQLDAGILPENTKVPLLKNNTGKPKAKKRICEADEDLQLAIALSTSITEEKEKSQASSLHSASSSKSTNLLFNLSKDQAEERISKRAASLIFSSTPPEESISQTPAFKRRKQDSDSQELNKFWDKTSLASPLKSSSSSTLLDEQDQPKQQSRTSTPYKISSVSRDVFYVPVLMPPITVDNSNVGSKLKPVSTIPGRQRSIGGQARQREEDILAQEVFSESNPEVESKSQVELQSQTIVNLAELAAENEEADSQSVSSGNCSSPLFLSPDVNEVVEMDVLSEVDSHQPEVDSCELKKLSSSFLSLVNCPKHADVQIVTSHGELVPAHKVVLFVRCPQLYEMCDDGMIEFSSYSKESVLSVLKYVYGGEISVMTDTVEDVIELSSRLRLPLLLEKAEGIRNENQKPSCLDKEKADDVCLNEDEFPDSFEERGEPADKASSGDHDAQNSNQSLGDVNENAINVEFNKGDGDHMEGVGQIGQLECSVEPDLHNTNHCSKIPTDASEMYLGDKQTEDMNELSAQKSTDYTHSPVMNQAIDGQETGISVGDENKQSKTDKTVSSTNPSVGQLSSTCSGSFDITKSSVDTTSHKDKISTENGDDDCSISTMEVENCPGREGMHNLVASWKKCLADTICHSVIPKNEIIEAHSVDDIGPPITEHSDTVVDPVANSEIQSVSDQQIVSRKQFDKDPTFTQLRESSQLPGSEMVQPLSDNQVPSQKNDSVNPLSLPIQELSNMTSVNSSLQGLNESVLQSTSRDSLVINKGTKSKARSKKVSTKEFKDLVDKAADGSLTDKDFERVAIKLEQDNSFFDKDVYIPSVLDDANPSNPNELEITDYFIPPKRFKSKIRVNKKIGENKDKKGSVLPITKPLNEYHPYLTHALSNPSQSLPATKTSFCIHNENVNVRRDNCPSESKLSTSHDSDVLFNSDDDLFDDIEEGKNNLNTYSTGGAVREFISSVMGSSVSSLTKTPNAESERDGLERNKTNSRKMLKDGKCIPSNSIVSAQNIPSEGTQSLTDSEMVQMELAGAIAADIQSIRSAEELSQSEDIESDIEMCPFRPSTYTVSTKPHYAESTPGSEGHKIYQQSLQQQLPESITPIKKPSASDSPKLNSSVGSSGKKKTQRGLTRLKKHTQSSSSNNSPNISATNCSNVEILSSSYCYGSRKENVASGSGGQVDGKNTLHRSDKSVVEDVIRVSDKQLEECRRNLNFDGGTTKEINEAYSCLPSSSFRGNQKLSSSSTAPSSAVTECLAQVNSHESFDSVDQSEAFTEGLVQCYTSKCKNSTVPQTSMVTSITAPNTSKLTSTTMLKNPSESHSSMLSSSTLSSANLQKRKPKDIDNSYSSRQRVNESSSNSHHSSSISKNANASTLLPSAPRTPDSKHQQTESKDAATPPSFTTSVLMGYSPVIKKGKGSLTSAMTDVSGGLPNNVNNIQNQNTCPLSSMFIDSVVTSKNVPSTSKTLSEPEGSHTSHIINKQSIAGVDLASHSASPADGDAMVPLRERLGISNPFGMRIKQLHSTASQNFGKSDKAPPSSAEGGVSTLKRAVANQKESVQSVAKRTENPQVYKSATPKGQLMSQEKKQYKEPSPFSPMPPYDEMNTPQLKKEVSKIGVRPMNKKRMNLLLKEVYRETHQYETDSDYEPTPAKQKCINSSSAAVAPSDSHVPGCDGSSSSGLTVSSHAKFASSSGDADRDAREEDDALSSSQESSYSDVENLPEESILQGWPEEEEINPTQMTQSSSEMITQRLLVFLRTKDLYEKILMYEPLELDVLKKRLKDAGIKIGMEKLMDFLDEQCITFSMKNMSNRNNNRPQKGTQKGTQKGRGRPGKTT